MDQSKAPRRAVEATRRDLKPTAYGGRPAPMIPIANHARIPSPRPPWHSQTYGGRNDDHIHIVAPLDNDCRGISWSRRLESSSANNTDAELVALGPKLEALIVDWKAQRAIDERRYRADEAARRRASFPDIEFGSVPDEEYRAYQEKRFKIHGKYAAERNAETTSKAKT